jgi:hypothetical protein
MRQARIRIQVVLHGLSNHNHFTILAYSLDNWEGITRTQFNAIVDEIDFQETCVVVFFPISSFDHLIPD